LLGFSLCARLGQRFESGQGATPEVVQESSQRLHPIMVHLIQPPIRGKTMLASRLQSFVPVWIGSTVGMVVADGLAIWVGRVAGRRLPERTIRYAAAGVFILSGLFTLYETLSRGGVF
jgi:Uncharacterized protein family UPF0016